MSGFFKNLKGLFIATDEDLLKKEGKLPDSETSESSPSNNGSTTDNSLEQFKTSKSDEPGQLNEQFMDILLSGIKENDQDGFDYLEFKQALQSLKEMNMDDATRYKSAFAMAKTMGVQPDYLVKTGEHYLSILQAEESKFMQTLSNQRTQRVDARKQELLAIDEKVKEDEAKIEELKAQIQQRIESKSSIQKEIVEASQKIESVHKDFQATYKHLRTQIKTDIENIKAYIN